MAARNGSAHASPGSILLVVHDFIARSPDELSLAKGDRIELIERDDDFGDGWFLGKHLTNGNSGLFPEVYTTPSPKPTINSASRYHVRANDLASAKAAQNAAISALSASNKQQDEATTATARLQSSEPHSVSASTANAQSALASTALRNSLPGNASTGGRSFVITSDSPVMSETLSVINEHITDMKSPRTSYANGSKRDTISSVYSSQHPPAVRRSYIAGQETDDEEGQTYTEDEVMSWSPARVAEYLEDTGVEKAHCDVFVDQEISGEVLLAMDQNSLFIKEFELGSVGRRLKTWHKIKALQDECRRSASPEVARSASNYSLDAEDSPPDSNTVRSRSSTIGAPSLPRALTTKRQSGDSGPQRSSTYQSQPPVITHSATPSISQRESLGTSPLQSMTSISRPENTYRPSAQTIRNLNHSRRHSSIDSSSTDGAGRAGHRKQPSIDQKWQPGLPTNGNVHHSYTASYDAQLPSGKSRAMAPASPADIERGYFSSNEADSRTRRSLLAKRNSTAISPAHSRASSILIGSNQTPRIADTDGFRDPVSPVAPSAHQFKAMNAVQKTFGSHRSATAPDPRHPPGSSPVNPVVTRLDPSISKQPLSAIAASPTRIDDNASEASSDKATPSPSGLNKGMFASAKAKFAGKRSTSEAVTKDEKVSSPTKVASPIRSATGSSTPSTEHRSLDITKSDSNARESTGSGQNLMPPPPSTKRPRAKSKKFTSAYTHGLAKTSPQEQMATCDYSGWMKKKSGSTFGTWKPRLFVLKGRRLSYYYKDDDTEEKGLIDISQHRVLPAQNETLAGMLATVTGAGHPSSPTNGTTPTIAQRDLLAHPPPQGEHDGVFVFKLVPPRAGLAKGVSFTKPTVHYFAVNSRQEGRLWMAALMKATIERDDNGVVTTTYNQHTISLNKARARMERPPALKEETVDGRAELATDLGDENESGLGITGGSNGIATSAGAEKFEPEDAGSMTPSTTATGERDMLSEKETAAVALSG